MTDEHPGLFDFVELYLGDREMGRSLPLDHYLARFPGCPDAVAREWARLEGGDGARLSALTTPDAPGPEPPERSLGPFRLLRELGRGGQGQVFLAEDTRLRRQVAIKILPGMYAAHPEVLARFRREASAASRLDHPGICAVHEFGVADGVPYIAMQHVPGRPLSAILASGQAVGRLEWIVDVATAAAEPRTRMEADDGNSARPRLARVLAVVENVARALHAAHEAGVIHRDVKPGNIVIRDSGEPVVLDFGLARMEQGDGPSLTGTGDLLGTPAYMSPEQLAGSALIIDRRTDVWSIGIVLFECLTLKRPFEAPTRERLYKAILTEAPPLVRRLQPRLPRDLGVVVAMALEKDRDRRYQTALDLADDLKRVRLREPVRARPAGRWVRTLRWAQRNPVVAGSLTLAILALTIGLAVSLVYKLRADEDLRRYVQMADVSRASALIRRETELFPRRPAMVPAMAEWLRKSEEILGRRPLHEASLAELRETDGAPDQSEDGWRQEWIESLLRDLDALKALRPQVERRLASALSIRERTVDGDEAQLQWEACLEDIAASDTYGHLRMVPQVGLVPLGRDARSSLWEFWVVESGERPSWDGRLSAGRVSAQERTGLILVLIPGGEFWIGAQAGQENGPNFEAGAQTSEKPVRVSLLPFFLSKFEMTQAQWLDEMGSNPSQNQSGLGSDPSKRLRLPVENVSWRQCRETLRRLDLDLPTEAQWECAARAGTPWPWWTGPDSASLGGKENLADATADRIPDRDWPVDMSINDGMPLPGPVGSFAPNPFGFHDMLGNVMEWCRDGGVQSHDPPRPGDGWRGPEDPTNPVHRGGSFRHLPREARAARRTVHRPGYLAIQVGLRPSRPIRAE